MQPTAELVHPCGGVVSSGDPSVGDKDTSSSIRAGDQVHVSCDDASHTDARRATRQPVRVSSCSSLLLSPYPSSTMFLTRSEYGE